MTAPLLAKAWTITANQRRTYASLNDTAGWWIFTNHTAIKAKWTLKCTSDGTTGPTTLADATDRLTNVATCSTRGAAAGNAQSWAMYTSADGVQLLIAYQGATDDVIRLAYSRAGLYVLAGTTNQQPTATDEVVVSTATIIGTGTSLDRVISIWVRDDGRAWSCACFRSAAIQSIVGCEQTTSLATVRVTNPIYDIPYCLYRYTATARAVTAGTPVGGVSATVATTGGGAQIRCYTDSARTVGVGSGEVVISSSAGNNAAAGTFNADKPAAQDGTASPLLPIYWSGVKGANTDGFFAAPIDWWQAYTSSVNTPAVADSFAGYDPGDDTNGVARSNWLVSLGSAMVRPWRNVAAGLTTS